MPRRADVQNGDRLGSGGELVREQGLVAAAALKRAEPNRQAGVDAHHHMDIRISLCHVHSHEHFPDRTSRMCRAYQVASAGVGRRGAFCVIELTEILGQSQPRLSRHLKLLCDAGVLERVREGANVWFGLPPDAELVHELLARLPYDDPVLAADRRSAATGAGGARAGCVGGVPAARGGLGRDARAGPSCRGRRDGPACTSADRITRSAAGCRHWNGSIARVAGTAGAGGARGRCKPGDAGARAVAPGPAGPCACVGTASGYVSITSDRLVRRSSSSRWSCTTLKTPERPDRSGAGARPRGTVDRRRSGCP